jgi:hypothetical protein
MQTHWSIRSHSASGTSEGRAGVQDAAQGGDGCRARPLAARRAGGLRRSHRVAAGGAGAGPPLARRRWHAFLADLGGRASWWSRPNRSQQPSSGAQSAQAWPRLADEAELPALPARAEGRLARCQRGGRWPHPRPMRGSSPHLLRARRSHARSPMRAVAGADLLAILWACQGVTGAGTQGSLHWHRTIGSGGNMHGARWFVLVLREATAGRGGTAVVPGAYEACFDTGGGTSCAGCPAARSRRGACWPIHASCASRPRWCSPCSRPARPPANTATARRSSPCWRQGSPCRTRN